MGLSLWLLLLWSEIILCSASLLTQWINMATLLLFVVMFIHQWRTSGSKLSNMTIIFSVTGKSNREEHGTWFFAKLGMANSRPFCWRCSSATLLYCSIIRIRYFNCRCFISCCSSASLSKHISLPPRLHSINCQLTQRISVLLQELKSLAGRTKHEYNLEASCIGRKVPEKKEAKLDCYWILII